MKFSLLVTLATCLALLQCSSLMAQDTKLAGNVFVSGKGNFRINLPAKYTSSNELTYEGNGIGSGHRYKWKLPYGVSTLVQFNYVSKAPNQTFAAKKRETIARFRLQVLADLNRDGTIVSEIRKNFRGESGYEVRASNEKEKTLVYFFFNGPRIFVLSRTMPAGNTFESARLIFDSFKRLTKKERMAQLLIEATPKPFPRTPRLERPGSDANEERLKGESEDS